MSKKVIIIIAAIVVVLAVAAVFIFAGKGEKNVEGTLEEIMAKVYEGIPEENLPMLTDIPVDNESVEGFLGTTEVSYKEALAKEPMISSIPHSVVLVRLNDAKDAEAAVEKIKASVNPRKWICVEASNVVVKSKGDLVILIMADTEMTTAEEAIAPKLEANFDNL